MGDIAIRVEHLSKLYRIGPREPYKALRDTLTAAMYAPFRAVSAFLSGRRSAVQNSPSNSYVWALKDVSFEVKRGEIVGIIGRNGAGKTTLLKILSRVTEPTEGYAEIHGRVGSLLEVGTGFHPELTGRENIYLSGIILGMKKAEIDRKFDEIVAFAEIEKFLDTPVKYYSSGMYVRLAFAVAAHLEPEILLVDEVLAVGDAAFQKKCLGKMGEVAKEGRTVLFVSHNIGAIAELCQRGILLDTGRIVVSGRTEDVIKTYLSQFSDKAGVVNLEEPDINKGIKLKRVAILDHETMRPSPEIDFHSPFLVSVEFEVLKPIPQLSLSVRLVNQYGINVLFSWLEYQRPYQPGFYLAWCEIPGELLAPGRYYVDVGAEHYRVESYHYAPKALAFDVISTDQSFDCSLPGWGVIFPKLKRGVEQIKGY
jgi:lipopolysaccharide transport system ATP-binding protein